MKNLLLIAATAHPVPWYAWVLLGVGIPLAAASIVYLFVVAGRRL